MERLPMTVSIFTGALRDGGCEGRSGVSSEKGEFMSTGWKRLLISINIIIAPVAFWVGGETANSLIGAIVSTVGFTVAFWGIVWLVRWVILGFRADRDSRRN